MYPTEAKCMPLPCWAQKSWKETIEQVTERNEFDCAYCTFDLNLLVGSQKSRILHSSKQDYCRSGKNNNLSQLWHCLMLETSRDMFHHKLLNKKHRYLKECHFKSQNT